MNSLTLPRWFGGGRRKKTKKGQGASNENYSLQNGASVPAPLTPPLATSNASSNLQTNLEATSDIRLLSRPRSAYILGYNDYENVRFQAENLNVNDTNYQNGGVGGGLLLEAKRPQTTSTPLGPQSASMVKTRFEPDSRSLDLVSAQASDFFTEEDIYQGIYQVCENPGYYFLLFLTALRFICEKLTSRMVIDFRVIMWNCAKNRQIECENDPFVDLKIIREIIS